MGAHCLYAPRAHWFPLKDCLNRLVASWPCEFFSFPPIPFHGDRRSPRAAEVLLSSAPKASRLECLFGEAFATVACSCTLPDSDLSLRKHSARGGHCPQDHFQGCWGKG